MLKKYKNKILIFSLVIVGIILILLSSIDLTKNKKNELSSTLYADALEKKIEEFLENIEGIHKATVIVTLDTTNEIVYAQNAGGLEYILTNDGSPIPVTEIYTTVRGVAIACTNGNNDEIKMRITELISAYLGIPSNRIKIVSIK